MRTEEATNDEEKRVEKRRNIVRRRKRRRRRARTRTRTRKRRRRRRRHCIVWFCQLPDSSSRSGWADINAQPTHPLCQLVRRMMIKNTLQHTLSGQWVREGFWQPLYLMIMIMMMISSSSSSP